MLKNLIFFFLTIQISLCSPVRRSPIVLDNLDIKIENEDDVFPEVFSVQIEEFGLNLTARFKKESNYVPPSVSALNNGNNERINMEQNHQTYREVNGKGFATLILNKDGAKKFRMHGRIFTNGSNHFDLISRKGTHVLHKRRFKRQAEEELEEEEGFVDMSEDYAPLPADNVVRIVPENERFKIGQRAFNGAPIVMDVETVVVVDPSVYQHHKQFLNSNNDTEIFEHIREYYAHVMNGVNDKYQLSFANDPDLRINIKLVHVQIITNTIDAPWTNVSIVGEAGNTTYNGKEVILATKAIEEFANYFKTLNVGVPFDHAIAVFNKDLWSDNINVAPDQRKGVVGFAYVSAICSAVNSVSLVEDIGSFANIYTIAHEIGHSLSAFHDGQDGNNCDPNDHYIMSAFLSYSNMTNLQRFSSCSIDYFKEYLLVDNQQSSAEAQCLLNINNNLPSYVQNADISITGQIWDANDQCKLIYGVNASFCGTDEEEICSVLFCFLPTEENCLGAGPGAEGTTCGENKVCVRGICTEKPVTVAPTVRQETTEITQVNTLPVSESSVTSVAPNQDTTAVASINSSPATTQSITSVLTSTVLKCRVRPT